MSTFLQKLRYSDISKYSVNRFFRSVTNSRCIFQVNKYRKMRLVPFRKTQKSLAWVWSSFIQKGRYSDISKYSENDICLIFVWSIHIWRLISSLQFQENIFGWSHSKKASRSFGPVSFGNVATVIFQNTVKTVFSGVWSMINPTLSRYIF